MQMVMTSPGAPVDPSKTGNQTDAEARRARFHSWDEDME